jgi:hypothetical protein
MLLVRFPKILLSPPPFNNLTTQRIAGKERKAHAATLHLERAFHQRCRLRLNRKLDKINAIGATNRILDINLTSTTPL